MLVGNRDQKILADLEKAKSIHPDLVEVLNFYEKLFQAQFAFKARLGALHLPGHPQKGEIHLANLAAGLPQIDFEELDMETAPFMDLFRSLCSLLVSYTGSTHGLEPEPLPQKILEHAREIFLSKGPLVLSGDSEDVARMASGFVLAPYLQLACDRLLPRIPPNLWHREYCPICGGRPSFASLTTEAGSRTLLCARCFSEWSYDRIGCPFCKSRESQTYYPSEDGRHRLYVCEACNRYLKTVDVREGGTDLCLPVEGIVTVSMDVAAQEKGYRSY